LTRPKPEARVTDWLQPAPIEQLYISVLTPGEIRKGIQLLAERERRDRYEQWLRTVLEK
jgi:toxin FitB